MQGLFKTAIDPEGLSVSGDKTWRGGCARDYW